jgi:phage/plasmid-associated DNA primase
MPPTLEGGNGTYNRRLTVIRFEKNFTEGVPYKRDYEALVYAAGPESILSFALEGLNDLIESGGIFSPSASSKATVTAWQGERDAVAQFLADIQSGEVLDINTKVNAVKEGKLLRSDAWRIFSEWHHDTFGKVSFLSRNRFYAAMRDKGVHESRDENGRYFSGLVCGPGAGAKY